MKHYLILLAAILCVNNAYSYGHLKWIKSYTETNWLTYQVVNDQEIPYSIIYEDKWSQEELAVHKAQEPQYREMIEAAINGWLEPIKELVYVNTNSQSKIN
ncbi:MAG: hypothetical protein V1647_05935 [Pseudomonadota bacterium]